MASKESLGRVRHFDLISQQIRIRHLRSISVRNLLPNFTVSGECLLDHLLETYFTLHSSASSNQNAIYTSEKIKYSLNPTWASFDPSPWTERHFTANTSFTVRIWGGEADKFRLIIEWKVHLPSLKYLGDQVKSGKYFHNTIIFGLNDGYYGAPGLHYLNEVEGRDLKRKASIKVELEQVQPSYKIPSVQRLLMIQKAIQQTQLSVKEVCHSIQAKVESDLKCTSQLSEEEVLKLKIKLLKEEFIAKKQLLHQEREGEQGTLAKLQTRESNLTTNRQQLKTDKSSLREHKKAHIEGRESLVKLNAQVNMRRRQLVSELMNIYPIAELQGSKEYVICGVRLPNCESDEFAAMDDETLSVALGYTCHLVSMIARYLELPLRYPVNSSGSRSTVNDFTIEKVQEKDRKFPLFSKGKEGTKFFYGTFLLNKNIAQIRQYNGLGTPNLRNTLPNLKDLLDSKFRSSDPVKSPPLTIIRKSPLKNQKHRNSTSVSSGSTESPPHSNPKLDYVLLKTMNASAADGKPVLPDQPAKPVLLDEPEHLSLVDQPALVDRSAKLVLSPNDASVDGPEKPVLMDQVERSSLPGNPTSQVRLEEPALPSKPDLLDESASAQDEMEKPILLDQEAKIISMEPQRKPVLPAPLSAAQLQQMQSAEVGLKEEINSDSLGPNVSIAVAKRDSGNNEQRSASLDGGLYIPSQGTGHGFLERTRSKKLQKQQGNATRTGQPQRTLSLKSRRSSTGNTQAPQNENVSGTNAKNDILSNRAENDGNDAIHFQGSRYSRRHEELKQEDTGTIEKVSDGAESLAQRQRKERTALLTLPSKTSKHLQLRNQHLFDAEGSIDFDVCENGEIDLR
ncbi:UV radiation resistance-associated protein-like [Montipora foliosa]|uniref:UV radiation resistance-associated protein-like n=1 Tax=Montipora foliosa TaxID=591990 RepID=UPI0035F2175D